MKLKSLQQIIDMELTKVYLANREFSHYVNFNGNSLDKRLVTIKKCVEQITIKGTRVEKNECGSLFIKDDSYFERFYFHDSEERQVFSTKEEAIAFSNLKKIHVTRWRG